MTIKPIFFKSFLGRSQLNPRESEVLCKCEKIFSQNIHKSKCELTELVNEVPKDDKNFITFNFLNLFSA